MVFITSIIITIVNFSRADETQGHKLLLFPILPPYPIFLFL
jgi:hypothetical protein